jgi:hypothetical protein
MSDLTIELFLSLENQVWNALVAGDGAADGALLSEDFLGVYPSGFANRSQHTGQLANGPTIAAFEISESQVRVVSETAVLLSYRADYRRTEGDPEVMLISSLWCLRDDRWFNVFSQDTPL